MPAFGREPGEKGESLRIPCGANSFLRFAQAVVFAGRTAFFASLRPFFDPDQTFYFVIPAKAGIHLSPGTLSALALDPFDSRNKSNTF
jgi:hypothetical protein